jgi:molecular chaperone DnaK
MAIVGIDLGTTNSCVAFRRKDGTTVVIENKEGRRTTPSVVTFDNFDQDKKIFKQIHVGESAKRQSITKPGRTIPVIKRLMGVPHCDIPGHFKETVAYTVVEESGELRVKIDEKLLSPPEISAQTLKYMKECAEDYLGEKITAAVITVPAYFNDAQRKATQDAGRIAGLEVKRIINEPTAAALAFGLDKKQGNAKIAVYDLGGGTFDISIIEIIEEEGDRQFEVKATNGDTFLGGEDFDQRVIDHLAKEFKNAEGIDIRKDSMALQRLKEAAEKAKIELSSTLETHVNLPYITADVNGPKHLNVRLTRATLEGLVEDLITRTLKPCKRALEDAKLSTNDIDDIILIGGQTRMPKVQEAVESFFKKKPRRDVNPDEAVAMGAAIQAGVLAGDVKDVLLLDVTPLSLGIETLGGVMAKVIEKNTTIPTKISSDFSTADDNQSSVMIKIAQGESPRFDSKDNMLLGSFTLEGISPAPRGMPQIEVTFDIDANGLLEVSATDKKTNKTQSIKIEKSGLSEEEIESMKRAADAHAEEDKKFQDLVQTRNMADGMMHPIEKAMKESVDKLKPEEKTQLEEALSSLKAAVKGEDKALIEEKLKALTEISSKMADRLYAKPENTTEKPDMSQPQADSPAGENVADAEFEEIKDKDK